MHKRTTAYSLRPGGGPAPTCLLPLCMMHPPPVCSHLFTSLLFRCFSPHVRMAQHTSNMMQYSIEWRADGTRGGGRRCQCARVCSLAGERR